MDTGAGTVNGHAHCCVNKMKIVNKQLKRSKIFSAPKKYDVTCLQDTHITIETFQDRSREWRGEIFYSPHTSKCMGQVLF